MLSFEQKTFVDSDSHKFVMTQNVQKDVVGIVTFDLIHLLPTNHIIAYITMAYQSL